MPAPRSPRKKRIDLSSFSYCSVISCCYGPAVFSTWVLLSDMEADTCGQFADLLVSEGEEHVADMLGHEVGGLGSELVTDSSVPGRLRGRHKEYEKLGAEPYIVESELYFVAFFLLF